MDNAKANVPKVRFPGFTDHWEQRKLKELAEFNPKTIIPSEFEYVDLESVVGTEMLSHRTEQKDTAPSRAQRLAQKGDLFYQTVRPYQRNNYLFEKYDNNYVFSTGYAQMRPYIDGRFLLGLVQTDNFVNVVLDHCTGTSYPAINSNDLSEIVVSVPTDEAEQKRIGDLLISIDKTVTLYQREIANLETQKKAVMKKIFSQEVRFKRVDGSEFPEWEENALSERTSNFRSGKNIEAEKIKTQGVYPVIGGNGIRGYTDTYNHEGIYAVVGRQGALCGNVNLIDGKNYLTEHAVAVRGDDRTDTVFLSFLLDHMNLRKHSGQSAQPGLAVSEIIKLTTLFPCLEEQRLIADFLSDFDKAIAAVKKELELWKELKKGLLQQMFV